MKALTCAVGLLVFVGLGFIGCTDEAQSPVSSTGQTIQGPGSLAKNVAREFTFVAGPTGVTDPGITKMPDGKVMLRGLRGPVFLAAAFSDGRPDIVSGTGEIEINFIVDFSSGAGESQGKLTLTPAAPEAGGGVWEFTWHGKARLGASGWTLPLKEEGHGIGGALTGMKCSLDHIVKTPVDISSWSGSGQGVVVSH